MKDSQADRQPQAEPVGGLSIDVAYVAEEDRLRMSLRQAGRETVDWWWTRRMTLRVLKGWMDKLQEVPLPSLESMPWMPSPSSGRDLAQEHALSLEFDGPRKNPGAKNTPAQTYLVQTVNLNISSTGCVMQLVAGQVNNQLTFTRKEAHAMLEGLAMNARQAQWIEGWTLPQWLGSGDEGNAHQG